ncbi:unnamed protein product, partial [Mesorhabditis belari]|uniref:Ubiquitin carboxyl-terminal hydrolase 7 n=1 Tax=Mesorhabditis belari TaxID=2138241 RepID=A0AAF3ES86_9BILA
MVYRLPPDHYLNWDRRMENGEHRKEMRMTQGDIVEVEMSDHEEEMSEGLSEKDGLETMDTELQMERVNSTAQNPQYSAEEENDPEDSYRPEGLLELEIDKFSDFARGPADVQQRLSKPIFVRGLPWKILAIPRDQSRCSGGRTNKALGFFLQCNGDSEMVAWNCIATATLKVVNQCGGESHVRRISHTFYPKENDWGYSQFMSCDQLLNPDNGYILNDTIKLEVIVSADAPHGVQWDSKKHAGYIGLKNQGATCYMNSLLQAFFFTNQLRKAVYEMPTEEDDSESSVALAMQRVFYDLQYSDKPVGTKKLTKSFGWDSLDSFLQHDVQELCRVLLDNLESKMKGTKVEGTIPQLFRGKMQSFIRCINVDYESSHVDDFYDVQLNVKGNNDILQSFRDYVDSERLDGENKYDAGAYGLQPAEKGVKFLTFPPILHLQLMRFQYDAAIDANVKINDRLEFPERLNLNDFVDNRSEDNDFTYVLHAVLVHSGDFHGGHYVVFINTKLNQPHSCWCKFDDDVVSRSSFKDAVTANYGGEDLETPGRIYTNAYMLVYIRQSCLDEVLSTINDNDIPIHLRQRFEAERNEEAYRKKEKQEAHLFTEIMLIREEKFQNHHGFDLFDVRLLEDECQKEKVKKKMNLEELYQFVASRVFGAEGENRLRMDFRLWLFTDNPPREETGVSLARMRPSTLITRDRNKLLEDTFDSDRNLIFVETPTLSNIGKRLSLQQYDDKNEMLMFIKLYQPRLRTLTFLGHIMMNFREPLAKYSRLICEMGELPQDARLSFYEEISPDRVRLVTDVSIQMCHEQVLLEISDGGILIVQNDNEADTYNSVALHMSELYNNIEVEISQHTESAQFVFHQNDITPPINGTIHLNWGMYDLCTWIGQRIDFDPHKILLWKMSSYNEKPSSYLQEPQYRAYKVKDLLSLTGNSVHDPRRQKRYRLVYTKMPVPVADLENRKQIKVQMMDEKLNITITLFPPKNGSVADLLDEARREFKCAENGTGILRLVYVGLSPNSTRVYSVFENHIKVQEVHQKIVSSTMYTARVEEIPKDQLKIGSNEHLLPVAHFDKEPSRMFGVPFLFKVTDKEPFTEVHERLRQVLDVPEKEYEKYKFALIVQSKIARQLDMKEEGRFVNLSEMRVASQTHTMSSVATMPLLGIDHLNKSRGARTGHATEKPIIIHN